MRATTVLWKSSSAFVDCTSSHVAMSGSISATVVSSGALAVKLRLSSALFTSEKKQAPVLHLQSGVPQSVVFRHCLFERFENTYEFFYFT